METFDAVVVGSGFGGSVMAYRLAEAGLSVCVLERGKAYPPFSFPRGPSGMRRNFWDPSAGLYGLFNFWSFRGSGALVASGLGGGSLISANVLLRKDPEWFVTEDPVTRERRKWPVSRAELDPHYDAVEKMIGVNEYPPAYRETTPKTRAFQEAASELKLKWRPLPLAVTFSEGGLLQPGLPISGGDQNLHDRPRLTCTLCGECNIGCNYGSKNTLDFNYLSQAVRCGAVIRTLAEVRSFARSGDDLVVRYVVHDLARDAPHDTENLPLRELRCRNLVLAAGTLGSTYLLLKNRDAFPAISARLGSRYSVNGDLLAFVMKSRDRSTGRQRNLDPSRGPVITGAIRIQDELDGNGTAGPGFYMQDGGHPELVNWLIELGGAPASSLGRLLALGRRLIRGRIDLDGDIGAELAAAIGECSTSSSSMPILSMGRDVPSGRMRLSGKHLEVDWSRSDSGVYYDRVVRLVRLIAGAMNGEYREDPSLRFLDQVLTAHPLGGCSMGFTKDDGVVDSYGEVFDCPGLWVADGSVMPGPVGANPSLTIAALADRFAGRLIDRARRERGLHSRVTARV